MGFGKQTLLFVVVVVGVVAGAIVAYLSLTVPKLMISWPDNQSSLT